ncbi:MAG: aldo/keto reductase [Phenylobacterium sp.]|jgi:aryl-alcohol dehydrogenase-like predicted oxidoreductase|uniref:aldo/keto reductase n=1 Tax=Phenylobacterium sp. TaxID=1871053 RepID=UPI00261DEF24|nr:aldo/keto reductase [Phenylobacterium sp.]MDB5427661.1 aldo/keto reductase [Phenylobacterium sp.]MDB5435850.1 aldo/keto reductase [Phenylobacterium sp.]MDB5498858.1 aldo/keto reductase [Phenylobacterium sp.]
MKKRRLGASGLKVSEVGLGCNNFGMRIDQAETKAVVDAALDAGITLFDTADIYGGTKSEEFLGKALGKRRGDIVLATKFGMQVGDDENRRGGSRRWIMRAVEDSLTRLGTDWIDLYQFHQPDPDTPIDETLRALDDLVTQGKVRYIGNSNFSGWQIGDADWTAAGATRFVSAQNQYSLLERKVEFEVLPACEHFGLGFLPFFPLASGLLSGKYRRGEKPPEGTRLAAWGSRAAAALSDRNFDKVEKLTTWAEERGHTILELAFAWLLGHQVVSSVIAGATSAEQVRTNAATAAWALTPEEVKEVGDLIS